MKPSTAKYDESTWLTPEERLELRKDDAELLKRSHKYLDCWWWRINNLYIIADEKGNEVLFRCRPAQTLLFCVMWFLNIILKARQLGFSTAIQVFILDHALFNNNRKCGVIAQGKDEAGAIFSSKILYPYERLPSWLKTGKRAVESKTSAAIYFKNESSIRVAVSFRSGTLQVLHVSEYGKICSQYPLRADEVQSGSLNAVHKGSFIFIESTAEGAAGNFFEMSVEAMELLESGINLTHHDFKFHFYPWYDDPKYVAHVPASGLKLTKAQDKYFKSVELAMSITLTDEQKNWYIHKERSQKGKMKQEFPSTPMEAFLTSGRKVFDADDLMRAEGRCSKPLIVYDIEPYSGKRTKVNSKVDLSVTSADKLTQNASGYLLVWELPDPDEDYAIGGDVAEGLEHGDRSSFDVVAKSDGRQVAHWFGHIDTKRFAHIIKHVGLWYSKAFVGIERNNHGHAVLQEFVDIYPTSRIYKEEYIDREDTDEETAKVGWHTSAQSKPILKQGLEDLLANDSDGIAWKGTTGELNIFVYDKKGRMGAQSGGFDDQVMSYMIAQEMRARMPKRRKIDNNIEHHSGKDWKEV
ncbi:terminase [Shewanella sp. 202IG2-18]|uniref:terminase n=1 Tax=Parashewanella hymeniacidonis TaxID=2807618 RepID=UPI00195F72F7|nr:terminase [Parashewanella hymeniacidonis]MBM7070884.1 terminase [Parashewanella hymeniacidonis]